MSIEELREELRQLHKLAPSMPHRHYMILKSYYTAKLKIKMREAERFSAPSPVNRPLNFMCIAINLN